MKFNNSEENVSSLRGYHQKDFVADLPNLPVHQETEIGALDSSRLEV